jgi:hypothetical protein
MTLGLKYSPKKTYLGHFYHHFMEDPIEKIQNIDRLMHAAYCHLQDYEFRGGEQMETGSN